MNKRFDNILETVGNTPVVRLNKLGPDDVNVFAIIESFDACKDGSLARLLAANNVSWNRSVDTDPYTFLPAGSTLAED